MARPHLLHFSPGGFGRPFEPVVARQAPAAGLRVTLVMPDPVRGMTPGRRRRTRMTRPVRQLIECVQRRHSVWLIEDVNQPDFIARIPEGAHGLVTAYTQIFRPPAIERFRTLVNVHPSLLPYYRGPDPFGWVDRNGEAMTGFTLHEVTERIDDGPILRQEIVETGDDGGWENTVDAALPVVVAWLRHLGRGEPFVRRQVDAGAVYRVKQDYTPQPDSRRPPPTARRYGREIGRLMVPARARAVRDLCLVLQGRRLTRPARDWELTFRLAEAQRLMAAFWAGVAPHCDRLPRHLVHAARSAAAADAARNRRRRDCLRAAVGALNEAGVEPLLGSRLVRLLAAEPDLVASGCTGGLELAVPAPQLEAARRALRASGADPDPPQRLEAVELRPSLGNQLIQRILPPDELYAAAEPLDAAGLRGWRLAPSAELLHAILEAIPGERSPARPAITLRHLFELTVLLDERGDAADWPWIEACVRPHGLTGTARAHLRLAHRLLGAPLPPALRGGVRRHEALGLGGITLGCWRPSAVADA